MMNDKLRLLEKLVNIDSGSHDKEGVDHVGEILTGLYQSIGFKVEIIKEEEIGNHLIFRHPEAKNPKIIIIAHLDTVFPKGTAKERPFRIEGDRAYGPGVIDMKASHVMLFFAMKHLAETNNACLQNVELIFNSDEEIGSSHSRKLIENHARDKEYALIMEPARKDGSVVTERRGGGTYTLTIEGRAAHAGIEPEKGKSAIEELAHKIVKLQKLNDYENGVSINVGLIEGGTTANTVSAHAVGHVDVRVSSMEQIGPLEQKIEEVCETPDVIGTRIELTGHLDRPPMVKTEKSEALYELAKEIAEEINIDLKETHTGGGSDASFTASIGVATLDGLGPIGGNAHSESEYLEIPSLDERQLLFTRLVERLSL
jgi:glutamate carboxypeptidase